ncbi:hypothetical protein CH368_06075 [Leptospira levettii]|nr:hypothetical protein CH368_06075 [Leptospira levettii]
MNNPVAIEQFIQTLTLNKNQMVEAKKDIGKRRSESMRDFYTFIQTYFSHYFKTPFGLQQLGLIQDIQGFQGKQFRSPKKMARALSRGFGKSTILSLCGVLWMVLRKEWHFVIMVSASLTQAKGFLQKIVDECEDNELLINDFPELRPAKDQKGQNVAWNDNDIVFRGNARIIAKGFLNSIRGTRYKQYRPDVLIVDDPDEEKDVESESRMQRKYRWFDRAALKLGSQWGIDVIVAYTTIHPRCLGEQIYNNKDKYWDWDTKKFSAIAVNEKGEEYSTWEEGASLSVLQKEREVDPITFARERQNVILAEVDQKFKGLIQTYNYGELKKRYPTFDNWRLMIGVDLSLGKNESSDLSAIVGVGQPPDDATMYVLYSSIRRRTPDVIEQDLLTVLTMMNWNLCGIDCSGNQEYFLLGMRKVITEYNKTAPKKITTPLREMDNPGDKVGRVVSNLQPRVASGIIKLRDDDKILFSQMEEYPHSYKDGMDGLEYAVRLLDRGLVQTVTTEQYQKIDATYGNRSETLEDIRDKRAKKLGFDPWAGMI